MANPASAAAIDKAFPPGYRTACGIAVITVDLETGCALMLKEAADFGLQPRVSWENAAAVRSFANDIATTAKTGSGGQNAAAVRCEAIGKILGLKHPEAHADLVAHLYSRGNKYNPGRAFPAEGIVEPWIVENKEERVSLLYLRMLIEIARIAQHGYCCPVLGIPLVANVSAGASNAQVADPDHCIPFNQAQSPIRITSRAANRMFGAMPWAQKGPILGGDRRANVGEMRHFFDLLQATVPNRRW